MKEQSKGLSSAVPVQSNLAPSAPLVDQEGKKEQEDQSQHSKRDELANVDSLFESAQVWDIRVTGLFDTL